MIQIKEDVVKDLTPREKEVLELMMLGKSNGAIARLFTISTSTVKQHVTTIYSKFGLTDYPPTDYRPAILLARKVWGIDCE